ncbi:ATP-dependent helicase [Dyadobacter flavalbus]|uniref:DNA 3'-5' helicase n=1 Tax=Dyadobacter flavalbus TaxID=2579942 RepID=A0A5M8QP61_9BACT|nr:ATP-dependent helicase [Dyadobacter flavalbus]KAA6437078.1 ATP-dependent helicase [Dyadobacter flavalbus]
MSVTTIASDDAIDIEKPFKVKAGPGAGKTHWLVAHIKNVLTNSRRLGSYRKVACITYTNTAADTIISRLNEGADRIETSTIHSFIYNNIIKPYMHFIASQYDFNVKYMDGHDEHFISRKYIKEWVDAHPNLARLSNPYTRNQLLKLEGNLKALGNWLSSIDYKFESRDLLISADNSKAYDIATNTRLGKTGCLDKLAPALLEYKKIFWRKGRLHHEDILFFGHKLITQYPFIVTVLQAKFPYFFIDEFQDTNPVQTEIIKLIAQKETIVGVIGDRAQAIYSFQGTSSADFDRFTLVNQQDFLIEDNRRSTDKIVQVLNHLRPDLRQKPLRNVPGAKPVLYVGTKEHAFTYAQSICGNEALISLSRDNVMVNAMKRLYNAAIPSVNLLDELFAKDNADRVKVVVRCIRAVELGVEGRYKEAIKEMEKNNSGISDKVLRRKKSFHQLSLLLSRYSSYNNEPLYSFYELVKTHVNASIPSLIRGTIKDFYTNNTFAQVGLFVDTKNDVSPCKTIHKAKGDEFDNVFVTMLGSSDVGYLMSPDLNAEEQRVRYVALSRARNRLFISVPSLTATQEATLTTLFDIQRPI